jgi:hypothetical protein
VEELEEVMVVVPVQKVDYLLQKAAMHLDIQGLEEVVVMVVLEEVILPQEEQEEMVLWDPL